MADSQLWEMMVVIVVWSDVEIIITKVRVASSPARTTDDTWEPPGSNRDSQQCQAFKMCWRPGGRDPPPPPPPLEPPSGLINVRTVWSVAVAECNQTNVWWPAQSVLVRPGWTTNIHKTSGNSSSNGHQQIQSWALNYPQQSPIFSTHRSNLSLCSSELSL